MSESHTKEAQSNRKSLKVTDRRMFTPDGELREEYRHLEAAAEAAAAAADEPAAAAPEPEPEPPPAEEPETEEGEATFSDLVSLLAEHASVYLRQASMPGGDAAQHMELARLHIDLLTVLKNKTRGNLSSQEQAILDDVLYRLRLAFTGHRGF